MIVLLLHLMMWRAVAQSSLVPDAAVMSLDDLKVYDVGYAYRGQPERRFPLGWSGNFEKRTGVACQDLGRQSGRRAFLLLVPWRGSTGIAFQLFTFRLPRVNRIHLRGATALQEDVVGRSDGVTFRIYANGRKLMEDHRTDATWKSFDLDLTAAAGREVTLRFETDPGPRDNPDFDLSLWGDRELVLDGYHPRLVTHPVPPPLMLDRLATPPSAGVVPSNGFAGGSDAQLKDRRAIFRYHGEDGELEYSWQLPHEPEDPPLGTILLRAQMRGAKSVEVPLARGARLDWAQDAQPLESRWEKTTEGIACVRTFGVAGEVVTLRAAARLIDKSLVLDVTCDHPVLEAIGAGEWGPVMRRVTVPVPYYPGRIEYLPQEDLFVNAFLDWTASMASEHVGTRADYRPRTDGSRNSLKERVIYSAAWHLAETLPNLSNAPSPHRKQVGSKVVLDIWGKRPFAEISRDLERLADHGIRDAIALIHDWQYSGPEDALPTHLPANTGLGGDEGMRALVATGTRLGYIVGLHENYADYYNNCKFFTMDDIALDPEGRPVKAWFNQRTKMQSFAIQPNAILPLARTQSPEIHRRYGTTACFLDVHSSKPPWFHVDYRAGQEGAGRFRRVWDAHRMLWQYERETHAGPVFGEGDEHAYWSGNLDGVEAQFGAGWPSNQGMSAPLMVDFDLLKIHPLQLNHGMGYYERWLPIGQWIGVPPMAVLDQYRMQEVAFGHAGFLDNETWSNLPLAWLESNLLTPVTARYATAKAIEVGYQVKGRWVDGTAAAKTGDWRRLRVRYDNGLIILANGAESPWRVGSNLLPQFGWLAQGAGVTAWTALRDGVVADYVETADRIFANARDARDWELSGIRRVRPRVEKFQQTAHRVFRVNYHWQINETLANDYRCFVHFRREQKSNLASGSSPDSEGILFQQDHDLTTPSSTWKRGGTVSDGPSTVRLPPDLADGDYVWNIGLYSPGNGRRVSLEGMEVGDNQIRLGLLHVRDGGGTIIFEPERRSGDDRRRQYQEHINLGGTVVDFGTVRTNGSVLVYREREQWVLRPLPRDRNFVLELRAERFGHPLGVSCTGGAAILVMPRASNAGWVLPLNGAKEYRWSAHPHEESSR